MTPAASLENAGFSSSDAAEVRAIVATMPTEEKDRAIRFLSNATKDPTVEALAEAAAALSVMSADEKSRLRRLTTLLCGEDAGQ
ncbi:hypothetical protein [Aureimonas psammosilenae]|uniref:hypothetical protein n=1 Tax=Aureimonas psammosilenae TaxID=2495496 RepID=UPI0012604F40|nr:hypothetical protein [Aureimonas psammosilenae]